MKMLNANKNIIECQDGKYRIGYVTGKVPEGHDCIINGWHIKKGKIVKQGEIIFVPGNGNFHITGNTIEN